MQTSDDGYNPSGAPAAWVDPVSFIAARLEVTPAPVVLTSAEQHALDIRSAALLANLAYNDNPGVDAGSGWSLLSRDQLGLAQAQWDNNSGDTTNSQFVFDIDDGQAIVSQNGSTLAISFRGSEELGDFLDDLVGGLASFAPHFALFKDLISSVHAYAASHGITNVLVAGHSLGGAMVEMFMSQHPNTSTISYSGVSFGSPGEPFSSNNPGSDPRLLNIGHSGDPVYRSATINTFGFDIEVNLPTEADLSLGGLIVQAAQTLGGDIGEHSGTLYNTTALMLTWSATLFERFIANPNLYSATILGSGNFSGGGTNDYIIGGFDASVVVGGLGNDLIFGNAGSDIVSGQNGNDWLDAGRGEDRLNGGAGIDFLAGGADTDQLTGGTQADVFWFSGEDFDYELPYGPFTAPDRITDFNQGDTGSFALSEGDLIDLSSVQFATSTGHGTSSTVRLISVAASGDMPAGALLQVLNPMGVWRNVAHLDNVASGQSVLIALTEAQSAARTGSTFVVDAVGNGTTWTVTPGSQNVAEGDVTITFIITRSGSSLLDETVYVSTMQTHGSYNDGDYVGLKNIPVFFAANDPTETITVRINVDAVAEGDETFGLIVQADPLGIVHALSQFTIQDGAPPIVSGTTWIGNELDNAWSGGSSNDLAFGMDGNDSLVGSSGNDILLGGEGNDTIYGGIGDDMILSGNGTDLVDSGSGNDVIDARDEVNSEGSISSGAGNDTVLVGSATYSSNFEDYLLLANGGEGTDLIIVEARDFYNPGVINHRFDNGTIFDAMSDFALIEDALLAGGAHKMTTGMTYSWGYRYSWVEVQNFEQIEYRGGTESDLFLAWNEELIAAYGGNGDDALVADWSTTTAGIVWNMSINNDAVRTLGNGVVVQSIERVMLRTGSGNDYLVLGQLDDHVETGSGNDTIDARDEINSEGVIAAGEGNDTVLVGSGGYSPNFDEHTVFVDGGTGTDTLVVEARDYFVEGLINHRFSGGAILDASSDFNLILDAINRGGRHELTTGLYYAFGYKYSWVDLESFERIEYRGGSSGDLFLGWNTELVAALGRGGLDTLVADWSTTTEAIVWNLTADNGTEKTLGNGVVVQSIERLYLQTGSGNDNLILGSQDDHIESGAGNDTLRGGGGFDTLIGGNGDDTYVVDGSEQIAEALNGGTDTVQSTITYNLLGNFENLTLTGTLNINATGNNLSNVINGNSGANRLDGGTGIDTLLGGAGNDTYVTDGGDWITEASGGGTDLVQSSASLTLGENVENLTLAGTTSINGTGNSLNNVLRGNAVSNVLNGTTGIDTLIGGAGNDTYVTDGGDRITEDANAGIDLVRSSASYSLGYNLENLTLTGTTAINGSGNALNNVIRGNAEANLLNGSTGIDTLIGGAGNDTYMTDGGDWITEASGGGTDLVQSSTSLTLGANVENLTLTGPMAINGTGNNRDNVLSGNAAANVLNGAIGFDTLIGGAGKDIYVTDGGDLISEAADAGIDLVQSSASYTLGSNLENLTLTGTAAINGSGNLLNNLISGNAAANRLNGGMGNDTLVGGAGTDSFIFSISPGAGNIDRISDFNFVDDTILLNDAVFAGLVNGVLAASAFAANISGNAGDATDRIIYETDTGRLFFDGDGVGGAARIQFAVLTAGLALTNTDFLVF